MRVSRLIFSDQFDMHICTTRLNHVTSIAVAKQSQFFKYLLSIGFRGKKMEVVKTLTPETIAGDLFTAATLSSVLKRDQVKIITAMAKQFFAKAMDREYVTEHRLLVARLLSINNYNHGQGLTTDQFLDDFFRASKFAVGSLELDEQFQHVPTMMNIVGMMAADGVVGSGKNADTTRNTQSCLNYNRAFAKAIHTAHDFETPVVVCPGMKQATHDRICSGNTRRQYLVGFSVSQVERMCFTLGALDHSRNLQWLLTLITRIIFHCCEEKDLPHKKKLLKFLRLILIVIRIWIPSPGYWVTVEILVARVDTFLKDTKL